MAVTFNGSTGILEVASQVVSAYPLSMMVWMKVGTASSSFPFAQQQTSANNVNAIFPQSNGTNINNYAHIAAGGGSASKTTSGLSTSAFKLAVLVSASATDHKIYYDSSASPGTDTGSAAGGISLHDRVSIGAGHYNGGAASLFFSGALGEAHFFNAALTTGQIDALLADTTKPEATTGWVDGWMLKDATDLTSIGGTRTLTLTGGATSTGSHPISRSTPTSATAPGATLTATATITPGAASASAAGSAPGATLTGTSAISAGAASAVNLGTLTTAALKNNTGTLLASETGVTLNVYHLTTGALVAQKTGVTTNSSGIAVVSDALIVAGTTYAYEVVMTGSRRRLPTKAAA